MNIQKGFSKNSIKLLTIICIALTVLFTACQNTTPPLEEVPEEETTLHEATLLLPGLTEPTEVRYEVIGTNAIFEGDIILGEVDEQGKLIDSPYALKEGMETQGIAEIDGQYLWPGAVVPYIIHSSVSSSGRANIQSAIAHWEAETSINFVTRTSQSDYISFQAGSDPGACSSWIGRIGGQQSIKLTPSGWCSKGTLIHEIGHAMGLYHEQSREDRDNHVRINWNNIPTSRHHNFDQALSHSFDVGPYDYASIMHYSAYAFSSNGLPTIETIPAGITIGQRSGLSEGDIATTQFLYGSLPEFGYIDGGWSMDKKVRYLADVNGDNKDDIVGFGANGVFVSLANGTGFDSSKNWVANYGYNQGWRVDKHPRYLADVNGDGKDDVVGFGNPGVYVSLSTGSSFKSPQPWVADYGYNQGWRVEKHPRYMADVNGDGKADVVGFDDSGVYVSLSTGSSFKPKPAQPWVANYGYNQGWHVDKHPRYLADVNGDSKADVVGFGNSGVHVSLSTGLTFEVAKVKVANYGYNQGWRVDKHPRYLADVNGDGKDDVVGFGNPGVYVTLSNGSTLSSNASLWTTSYGYNQYWHVDKHPRYMADVNGDGKDDVVGFGDRSVYVATSTGSGFKQPNAWIKESFGYATNGGGWQVDKHPRLLADINGDGKQDIVGFANYETRFLMSTY